MMNKTDKYNDKEWEELASFLSEEKHDKNDLLNHFIDEDINKTGEQWKELSRMRDQKKIDVDKAWNNLHSRLEYTGTETIQPLSQKGLFRISIFRIAAIGLIMLALASSAIYMNYSGYFSKKITYTTAIDHKNLIIDLPDGSKITLNRNSEFSYRANFGKHNRNVNLTGEAFFEISPDASRPFIIDAGKANVKVVGTSFNVITKNSESAVEVYVKTGKVQLSDKSGSLSLLLEPEYIGTINSEISNKTVNTNPNYLSCYTGHLVYNGQSLELVFSDLKRVYNMNIIADDQSIIENRWTTAPIDNQPQDTIIQLICASFNLGFTKDGNVYHLFKK